MSNMIKSYSVRYDKQDKITINNHFRLDKKLELEREHIHKEEEVGDGEFVEGIKAVVVEELPTPEETSKKTEKIIEDATNEAAAIIDNAKIEAEKIKKDTFETALKKGLEEGSQQVELNAQKLKADYEEKNRKLQKEYDERMLSIEPHMAELIAELVEKITGILVKDNKEVILYLIDKSIKNLEKSDSYTIRVCEDDFEAVSARKDNLLSAIGRDVLLNITADVNLSKNQCFIETDSKLINCSLDVQLNNLITDLKLIGGI